MMSGMIGRPWVGKAWRVDYESLDLHGLTAYDVVRFEEEELGNDNHVPRDILDELKTRPHSDVVWVCKSKRDCEKYVSEDDEGEPELYELPPGSIVIGEDGEGGYLILKEGLKRRTDMRKKFNSGKRTTADMSVDELKQYFQQTGELPQGGQQQEQKVAEEQPKENAEAKPAQQPFQTPEQKTQPGAEGAPVGTDLQSTIYQDVIKSVLLEPETAVRVVNKLLDVAANIPQALQALSSIVPRDSKQITTAWLDKNGQHLALEGLKACRKAGVDGRLFFVLAGDKLSPIIQKVLKEIELEYASTGNEQPTRISEVVRRVMNKVHGVSYEEVSKSVRNALSMKGWDIQPMRGSLQKDAVAPPGWEGTVKKMKKHKEIDNPWALAWSMKNKGDKPGGSKKKSAPIVEFMGFDKKTEKRLKEELAKQVAKPKKKSSTLPFEELMDTRRWVYYIDPTQDPKKYGGYVPSIVIEDESGYWPMTGRGEGSAPWVWGKTLAEAEEVAASQNAKHGYDDATVQDIIMSSMFPGGYRAPSRGKKQ